MNFSITRSSGSATRSTWRWKITPGVKFSTWILNSSNARQRRGGNGKLTGRAAGRCCMTGSLSSRSVSAWMWMIPNTAKSPQRDSTPSCGGPISGWANIRSRGPEDFIQGGGIGPKTRFDADGAAGKNRQPRGGNGQPEKGVRAIRYAPALTKLDRGLLLEIPGRPPPGATPWSRLTRAQRNEIAADWMGLHLRLMLENVKAGMATPPGLMAYLCPGPRKGAPPPPPPEFREADLEVELNRMTDAAARIDLAHRPRSL